MTDDEVKDAPSMRCAIEKQLQFKIGHKKNVIRLMSVGK